MRRRRKGKLTLPLTLALTLMMLLVVPVADAIAGARQASVGCELMSIVDGDTLSLNCPGMGTAEHEVMGLDSPPVMGARCLSEAWWGLRSRMALRSQIWRAEELTFITEPRAHLAMVLADGVPLHRLITPVPANLCT